MMTSRGISMTDTIYKNRDDVDKLKQRIDNYRTTIQALIIRIEELEKAERRKRSTESNLSINKLFLNEKGNKKCCIIL